MDIYRSLAVILASSSSASSSPVSLVASQLSAAPSEQKPALSRVLAELLRSQSTPDPDAQKVLHGYVRTLVSTVSLGDVSTNFKLAVELADEGLLVQILDETVVGTGALLYKAKEVHISSDDAFAVDSDEFLESYLGSAATDSEEKMLDRGNIQDTVVRQLRFWYFLFIAEVGQAQATNEKLYRRIANVLPARLLAAMGLRDLNIAKAASNALCCFVNDFYLLLPAGSSEVLFILLVVLVTLIKSYIRARKKLICGLLFLCENVDAMGRDKQTCERRSPCRPSFGLVVTMDCRNFGCEANARNTCSG
jgi:hypothetical protein